MKKLVIENKFNRKILKILKKVILVNLTRDRFHYFLIAMQISAMIPMIEKDKKSMFLNKSLQAYISIAVSLDILGNCRKRKCSIVTMRIVICPQKEQFLVTY